MTQVVMGERREARKEEAEDKERQLQELARKVLEEEALGDIGDTSDTEIEKSDYEGRGSPCSQNTVLHMWQP